MPEDHHHLTDAEIEHMLVQVLEATRAGDGPAVAAATNFDPCRHNVGLLMVGLTTMCGALLRDVSAQRFGDKAFAMPHFGPDATDEARWAGRMLAVAINDDQDMLGALVDALLEHVERMDPPSTAGTFCSAVLMTLMAALRTAVLAHDAAAGT